MTNPARLPLVTTSNWARSNGGTPVPPTFITAEEMRRIMGTLGRPLFFSIITTTTHVFIADENYRPALRRLDTGPVLGQPLVESPSSYLPTTPHNTPKSPTSISSTPTLVSDITPESLGVNPPTSPVTPDWARRDYPWPTEAVFPPDSRPLLDLPPSPLSMPPPLVPPVMPEYEFTFQYPDFTAHQSFPRTDTPFPTEGFDANTIEAVNNLVESITRNGTLNIDIPRTPSPADTPLPPLDVVSPTSSSSDTNSSSSSEWSERSITPYTASEIARSWEDSERIPEQPPIDTWHNNLQEMGLQDEADTYAANNDPVPPLPTPTSPTTTNEWAQALADSVANRTEGAEWAGPVRRSKIPRRIHPYPPIKVVNVGTIRCGLCSSTGHRATSCEYAKRCEVCDKIGHIKEECPHRQGRCWHCRSIGHQRHNCPQRTLSRRLFKPVKNRHYYQRRSAAIDALKNALRFLKNQEYAHRTHGSATQAHIYKSLLEDVNVRLKEIQEIGHTRGFPAM